MRKVEITFTVLFFMFSIGLLALNLWLRFFEIPKLNQQRKLEESASERIRSETTAAFKPELREFLAQYAESIAAVDSIFHAREKVFSGSWKKNPDDAFVVLDMMAFLRQFQSLLLKNSILQNFSIDPMGKISFLIRAKSYEDAGKQMEIFLETQMLTAVDISSINRSVTVDFIVQARINPEFYYPEEP